MGKSKIGGDGASAPIFQPENIPAQMIEKIGEAFKNQPEQVVLLMLAGSMIAGPPAVKSLAGAVADWGEKALENPAK